MGWYYDYNYPEGFNAFSEEDWDDLVMKANGDPSEYTVVLHDGVPEWRKIPGYSNYEASDFGYIRSNFEGKEPHRLQSWSNQHGHQYVSVADDNGKSSKQLVHRLVASSFCDNPNNHMVVRHLNDCPMDNRPENLAWGTAKDNREDMIRNGHDFRKSVYCYELDKEFRTGADAADYFGVCRSDISLACSGKSHTVKGNHICYADEKEEKLKNVNEWMKKHDGKKALKAINRETGEELYFESRKEAGKKLNIPDCGISNTINGRIPHSHGWIFENVEDF